MAFEEDLALFFDTAEFAVEALATTRLGESVQLKVIFDAPHVDALGIGGMEASQPAVMAATHLVRDLAHGDILTVDQEDFRIVGAQPDGTGVTRFLLERSS
jgi:hypothetical protein